MRLQQIINLVEGKSLSRSLSSKSAIRGALAADLMSDVLASSRPHTILLTGLCTPQVIRTAQMADIAAVILVRGKRPSDQLIELANEEEIPLIGTRLSLYEACGRLFEAGLEDGSDFPSDGL